MTFLSRWPRARKQTASAVALAVLAGVPVTFALLHDGFPVSDVDLETRDVWITNSELGMAGKLNRQIDELTMGVVAASPDFDVVQDGLNVFLHDVQNSTLERIDPARATLIQRTDLPQNAAVSLGDTALAITGGPEVGLWTTDVSNELSLDPTAVDPQLELGEGGQAVVGRTGAVFATSPEDGRLYSLESPGAEPEVTELKIPAEHQLTVVGDVPVIFDAERDVLLFQDGRTQELGADGIRVQQPGETHDTVLVATGDALVQVPIDGGEPTSIPADIAPMTDEEDVSAPVWLDGCAHGAWSGAQRYLYACEGETAQPLQLTQPTVGFPLEFRVNRKVIALNNLINGNAWIMNQTLRFVDNWEEITPPEETEEEEGEEKSSQQSFEDTLAERTEQNRPPVARDDEYGVRPGRTTILPVLDNDTDPDGDVLVITNVDPLPESIGRLDYIDGGRALQFTPGTATSGSATVRYTVEDGRPGGIAQADVLIRIVPEGRNSEPKSIRSPVVQVEAGQRIEYNVLVDWFDPDGDDLFLESAVPASGDDVSFTPDGFVTFTHNSSQPGEKTVSFVVSDGTGEGRGELTVDVQPAGSLDPIGTPDYVEAYVGDTIVVEPLENDVSPSGKTLRLLGVEEVPPGVTVEPNLQQGNVSVTALEPGAVYFQYSLAAGANSSIGLIRVEVRETPEDGIPPVAVKDSAFLRAGEAVSVRPLTNDVSPSNRVLGIQSVDTSMSDPAVSVELINSTVVRVTSSQALTEQTQFTYTVSDGLNQAVAGVTVVPVSPIVKRQPPVAVEDSVKVRAGDIVTVDVLKNDFHPDRQQMLLSPKLETEAGLGGGLAFVGGDKVRFQAPDEAGEYTATYRNQDQFGESATAPITFVVIPRNDENSPPIAETQTARTFVDSQVRIEIPLDNIDPDGDSVILNDIITQPGLGRIVEQGPTWIVYEAYPDSAGSDRFEYQIEDAYGAKTNGEIVVGVIPRPDQRAKPNAVDDKIAVRPGKTSSVEVLLNDSDPNGYQLTLSRELSEIDKGLVAEVEGPKVIVTAPDKEGVYVLRYEIDNKHGGTDTAFLLVTVDEDAPLLSPKADDHYVLRDEMDGAEPIDVDVLDLVNNPNGRDRELLISVDGPGSGRAVVDQENGTISVTPETARSAVAYTVTDPNDGELSGSAFIVVPSIEEAEEIGPPFLREDLERQVVEMNGEKEWDLADIVTVPSGNDPRLTVKEKVSGGNGSGLWVDEDTISFTPRPDFRGQAYITFEVTDGTGPDDPNGREATLRMPITVGDPEFRDLPPEFTSTELQIEAGEGAGTLDLRSATSHPNPSVIGQIEYGSLSGAGNGIAANVSGGTLSAEAPFGTQPGASATLNLTLRYREFEVPGTVTVTVVASTRPLAQTVQEEIKAQRNVPTSHNVLAGAYNPFADSGQDLRLVDATVENAAESAAGVSFDPGGQVTVSPGPAFIGVVSVVYTVEDATKDPNRHVTGRLLVNVRDVPDQPAAPAIVQEQDQAITISWRTPATNGEPILDYRINWNGGQLIVGADQSQATITGLTNGTDYRFTVTARNILGDSTTSAESPVGNPYGVPTSPRSASIRETVDGSGRIDLTWNGGDGNGRPIERYEITFSDQTTMSVPGDQLSASAAKRVGVTYTYSIVSVGPAGKSPPTQSSGAAAQPKPGPPSNPRTSVGADGDPTVTYTWNAGRSTEGMTYEININGNGWKDVGGGTTYRQDGQFGNGYSFKVRTVSNGVRSAATGDSNTSTPRAYVPPAFSGSIGKGPSRACDSGGGGCANVRISWSNLTPGRYRLYATTNGSACCSYSETRDLGPNGQVELLNHLGVRNDRVGVRLEAVGGGARTEFVEISGGQWNNLPFNSW